MTPRQNNLNVTVPDGVVRTFVELRRLLAKVAPLSAKGTAAYDRAYREAADINRELKNLDAALAAYLEELAHPKTALMQQGRGPGHEGRPGQERPSGRAAS